jgi:hypothetical protein
MSCKPLIKFKQTYKRSLALLMLVWFSGVTCLFSCDLRVAASGNESLIKQEKERATRGIHSCCRMAKTKRAVQTLRETPGPPTKPSCCPFTRQPTEQARKETAQTVPAAIVPNNFARLVQPDKNLLSNLSYRARLPDRGGTHLRICVFLI